MLRYFQNVGRAFMLPVAVLPAAGLLVGISRALEAWVFGGEANAFTQLMFFGGLAILENLAMIFAVGLAFGMSHDKNGAAALSGLISYLVVTHLLSPDNIAAISGTPVENIDAAFGAVGNNVLIGITTGLISAALYNKFHTVKLPDYLGFFSGRRAVPIIASVVMILLGIIFYIIWPTLYGALVSFGAWISGLGAFGAGIYGFLNRLLIPTGLHHALNSVFWFDTVGINDIGNFWSGEGTLGETGRYMAGFFPIMMFGLPGAALAMYHTSKSKYKKAAASILLASSLTAFLTGITEPLEFSFMFLAPLLYVIHALLTGISLFIAASFEWTAGFVFSAGLVDYLLSFSVELANQPYMLALQGLVFFVTYYVIFRVVIQTFNLNTPGRDASILGDYEGDDNDTHVAEENNNANDITSSTGRGHSINKYQLKANRILDGLGGPENVASIDNCTTRLRLNVKDDSLVDNQKIKSSGAHGVVRPGKNNVQVVVGTEVEFVADELRKLV